MNHGVWTVVLQRRRLRTDEPEDNEFVFRRWADWQFLIMALARLRRAASMLAQGPSASPKVKEALKAFDQRLPGLRTMRNIGEHIDAYALNTSDRHEKRDYRPQLQVGAWDGRVFSWLGHELDVDVAVLASEAVFAAVCEARPTR